MSTGMRKWMEKDCSDTPSLSAEVSIDREELRQLRDELAHYKNERDALRAKIETMERQEPVASVWRCDNNHIHGSCEQTLPMGAKLYALPGAQGE